jgi:hypothetical protein
LLPVVRFIYVGLRRFKINVSDASLKTCQATKKFPARVMQPGFKFKFKQGAGRRALEVLENLGNGMRQPRLTTIWTRSPLIPFFMVLTRPRKRAAPPLARIFPRQNKKGADSSTG